MITKRTKIQLVIFTIITLLGVSFVGAKYAQLDRLLFDDAYNVTAHFADSGGIFEGAENIGWVFPNQETTGAHVNIAAAGVAAHAPHPDAAISFLEYLTTPEAQEFFARGAHSSLAVERSLHETYLARAAVRPSSPPSVVTRAYVHHLAAVAAHGSYAEVVAAVLPCYWVYAKVGVALLAQAEAVPGHPYRDWVATYGSAPFTDHAAHACRLADAAAQHADPATRERMVAAFDASCRHEVAFFGQVAVTATGQERPVVLAVP